MCDEPNLVPLPTDKMSWNTDYHPGPIGRAEPNRAVTRPGTPAMMPLTVCENGDGTYTVIDGVLRLEAARRMGFGMILCELREPISAEEQAREFVRLNSSRPVSLEDEVQAFVRLNSRRAQ